jgi:hypothetical protein
MPAASAKVERQVEKRILWDETSFPEGNRRQREKDRNQKDLENAVRMRQLIELWELSRSSAYRPIERKNPMGKINKPNQGGDMYPSMNVLRLTN